jgi:hypothetical protein
MISRRSFMVGGCCALHAASMLHAGPTSTQQPTPGFICSTIEPPREDQDGFVPFSAIATPAERQATESKAGQVKMTPYGTAFFSQRWNRAHGLTPNTGLITLGVHFLEGSSDQRDAVRRHASEWISGDLGKLLTFEFDVPRHRSQIRVAFTPQDGNWSYVGNQNRNIAPSQKTMNIENLSRRVVCHEFGHAIGLQHEHLHPAAGIVWDEPAVIADMAAQGWSEAQTRSNILTRYGKDAACIGDAQFNRASIMIYPVPRHWTKNGFSVGQTDSISPRDVLCLTGLYS